MRNILLLLISTALSLFLAELATRWLKPQHLITLRPDLWCPDEGLGWVLCPNVDASVDMGDGPARIHTDAEGHRVGSSRDSEKPDVEILAVGDSFVEAMQVGAHETMTELLGILLTDRLGRLVTVVNAGVASWNPNQYLIRVRRELQKNPAYAMGLVFLYPDNDVVPEIQDFFPPKKRGVPHRFRIPDSPDRRELVDALLYPVNDYLERCSHLFVFLRIRMKTVLMRLGLSGYQITPVYFREFADSPDWETTGTILKEIAVEFGRYNIPVIFVLLPAIYQVQPETFLEYAAGFGIDPSTIDLDQPNRILSRALEKAGLISVDTTPVLKEAAARGEVLYGAVDPHFTARGHRIVAELLQSPVEKVLSR